MNRRRALIEQATQGGYVQDGLVCWVDGILNQSASSGTITDQKGNYAITKSGGNDAVNNSNYIVIDSSIYSVPCGALTDTNSYTISLTYRKRSNKNGETAFMYSILPYQVSTPLGRSNLGFLSGETRFRYYICAPSNRFYYSSDITLNDFTAHTIDLVADGYDRKIYIDGVQVISDTLTVQYTNNLPIQIGGYPWNGNYYIDMELYSFKLYNKPLSTDEIATNYNTDKARFNL